MSDEKECPFSFQFKNGKEFVGIIESVSKIIDECRVDVTPKKLSIGAMDGSHICLIYLCLQKEDFDEYNVSSDISLGINLLDLIKILKRIGPKDEIRISGGLKDKKLSIGFKDPTKLTKERKFYQHQIDLEIEAINVEKLHELEFAGKYSLPINELSQIITDGSIFSEVIGITASGNNIMFTSEGTIGDMECNLILEQTQIITPDTIPICNFAIKFLKHIIDANVNTNTIEIGISDSQGPLNCKINLYKSGSFIEYFLASRVEEENNGQNE